MTEKIKQYIGDLKSLFEKSNENLVAEREKNKSLNEQVHTNITKTEAQIKIIANLESDISQLKTEITQLEDKLTNQNMQNGVENKVENVRDEQIAELVKEIEGCIAQLKNNQ